MMPHDERRLAAILCADVAEYSRLMNQDEGATLRLLTSYRAITDRLIGQHRGRIANTAGDSILAEFPTATDALRCALAIQDRLAAMNEDVRDGRKLTFRIGIHVGEVTVRDGDLFGDGVNIAARLQALALPGAICLSETATQFAQSAEDIVFEDMGPQTFKNIDKPVRAYLIRPQGSSRNESIPLIYRHAEFHLARRYHKICNASLLTITQAEALTGIEYALLASLDDAPRLTLDGLALRTGLDETEAANILRCLCDKGLVARSADPVNTDVTTFKLTSRGLDIRVRLRPIIAAAADQIVAPLSDQERGTLRELLSRIVQAHELSNATDVAPHVCRTCTASHRISTASSSKSDRACKQVPLPRPT